MVEDVGGLDQERMIVLSLRPRFAEAILAGVKTVEFRRREPRIVVPTRALLYAASPVRALVGTCVVTSVESAGLVDLWGEHGPRSGLALSEFESYFEGAEVGTALTLAHPQRFRKGVSLQDLRAQPGGFRPPQSFAYVGAETGDQLLRLAA